MRSVLVILVICWATLVDAEVTREGGPECCPEGQKVLRRKTNPQYCWDPVSNATTFVTLTCNETVPLFQGASTRFMVNQNKQLVILNKNFEVEYEPGSFCTGHVTTLKNTSINREIAVICIKSEAKVLDETIFGWSMAVSCLFLVVTSIIYAAFSELRDLQGKSTINLCVSLGIGLGILAIMKLMTYMNMHLCAARGFLAYFFIIASFFWANAISIQILLSVSRPSVSTYGWTEFIYYAIYAWGCPVILTVAMAIVNYLPGDHLKPGIGLNHCWFFNKKQQWQYMYSVMTILISINIVIFIYTSMLLWRQKFSSSHLKALRFKFAMTIRLFIVMGVAWIFEMVGTLVESHIIWEIFDLLNSLQGVFIFLVLVVFRRRVIKVLHKHGWLGCIGGPVERCLAKADDEEEVAQHTLAVTMDDRMTQ